MTEATTPGQAATADVVAAITAAVDQLCACGCRTPLDPDGPSGYFASQGCQERWYNTQATDPDDVYQRPDATHWNVTVRAPHGNSGYAAWLAEQDRGRRPPFPGPERCADPPAPERCRACYLPARYPADARAGFCRRCYSYTIAPQDLAPDEDRHLHPPLAPGWWRAPNVWWQAMGYRRWCGRCEAYTEPGHLTEDFGLLDLAAEPTRPTYTRRGCPGCDRPYDGPPPAEEARLTRHDGRAEYVFELHDGDLSAHYAASQTTLHTAPDPRAAADRIWRKAELELVALRASRRVAGVGCVDPAAIIRAVGNGT